MLSSQFGECLQDCVPGLTVPRTAFLRNYSLLLDVEHALAGSLKVPAAISRLNQILISQHLDHHFEFVFVPSLLPRDLIKQTARVVLPRFV